MSATRIDWSRLPLPFAIPELVVTPTRMQLFMFSAATWNRHRIHYDKDAAIAEGHPDVVVHRALLGNFLARMLSDWLGDCGMIRELSWKVQRSALPDQRLRCQGEVTELSASGTARQATCALRILNEDGQPVATGSARIEAP